MSVENVSKFYDQVKKDKSLREELDGIVAGFQEKQIQVEDLSHLAREKIIPLAKKNGYEFSEDELFDYFGKKAQPLDVLDLDQISGGISRRTAGIGLGAIMLLGLGGTTVMNMMKGQPGDSGTSMYQSAPENDRENNAIKEKRVEPYPGSKSGKINRANSGGKGPEVKKAEKIERIRPKSMAAPDSRQRGKFIDGSGTGKGEGRGAKSVNRAATSKTPGLNPIFVNNVRGMAEPRNEEKKDTAKSNIHGSQPKVDEKVSEEKKVKKASRPNSKVEPAKSVRDSLAAMPDVAMSDGDTPRTPARQAGVDAGEGAGVRRGAPEGVNEGGAVEKKVRFRDPDGKVYNTDGEVVEGNTERQANQNDIERNNTQGEIMGEVPAADNKNKEHPEAQPEQAGAAGNATKGGENISPEIGEPSVQKTGDAPAGEHTDNGLDGTTDGNPAAAGARGTDTNHVEDNDDEDNTQVDFNSGTNEDDTGGSADASGGDSGQIDVDSILVDPKMNDRKANFDTGDKVSEASGERKINERLNAAMDVLKDKFKNIKDNENVGKAVGIAAGTLAVAGLVAKGATIAVPYFLSAIGGDETGTGGDIANSNNELNAMKPEEMEAHPMINWWLHNNNEYHSVMPWVDPEEARQGANAITFNENNNTITVDSKDTSNGAINALDAALWFGGLEFNEDGTPKYEIDVADMNTELGIPNELDMYEGRVERINDWVAMCDAVEIEGNKIKITCTEDSDYALKSLLEVVPGGELSADGRSCTWTQNKFLGLEGDGDHVPQISTEGQTEAQQTNLKTIQFFQRLLNGEDLDEREINQLAEALGNSADNGDGTFTITVPEEEYAIEEEQDLADKLADKLEAEEIDFDLMENRLTASFDDLLAWLKEHNLDKVATAINAVTGFTFLWKATETRRALNAKWKELEETANEANNYVRSITPDQLRNNGNQILMVKNRYANEMFRLLREMQDIKQDCVTVDRDYTLGYMRYKFVYGSKQVIFLYNFWEKMAKETQNKQWKELKDVIDEGNEIHKLLDSFKFLDGIEKAVDDLVKYNKGLLEKTDHLFNEMQKLKLFGERHFVRETNKRDEVTSYTYGNAEEFTFATIENVNRLNRLLGIGLQVDEKVFNALDVTPRLYKNLISAYNHADGRVKKVVDENLAKIGFNSIAELQKAAVATSAVEGRWLIGSHELSFDEYKNKLQKLEQSEWTLISKAAENLNKTIGAAIKTEPEKQDNANKSFDAVYKANEAFQKALQNSKLLVQCNGENSDGITVYTTAKRKITVNYKEFNEWINEIKDKNLRYSTLWLGLGSEKSDSSETENERNARTKFNKGIAVAVQDKEIGELLKSVREAFELCGRVNESGALKPAFVANLALYEKAEAIATILQNAPQIPVNITSQVKTLANTINEAQGNLLSRFHLWHDNCVYYPDINFDEKTVHILERVTGYVGPDSVQVDESSSDYVRRALEGGSSSVPPGRTVVSANEENNDTDNNAGTGRETTIEVSHLPSSENQDKPVRTFKRRTNVSENNASNNLETDNRGDKEDKKQSQNVDQQTNQETAPSETAPIVGEQQKQAAGKNTKRTRPNKQGIVKRDATKGNWTTTLNPNRVRQQPNNLQNADQQNTQETAPTKTAPTVGEQNAIDGDVQAGNKRIPPHLVEETIPAVKENNVDAPVEGTEGEGSLLQVDFPFGDDNNNEDSANAALDLGNNGSEQQNAPTTRETTDEQSPVEGNVQESEISEPVVRPAPKEKTQKTQKKSTKKKKKTPKENKAESGKTDVTQQENTQRLNVTKLQNGITQASKAISNCLDQESGERKGKNKRRAVFGLKARKTPEDARQAIETADAAIQAVCSAVGIREEQLSQNSERTNAVKRFSDNVGQLLQKANSLRERKEELKRAVAKVTETQDTTTSAAVTRTAGTDSDNADSAPLREHEGERNEAVDKGTETQEETPSTASDDTDSNTIETVDFELGDLVGTNEGDEKALLVLGGDNSELENNTTAMTDFEFNNNADNEKAQFVLDDDNTETREIDADAVRQLNEAITEFADDLARSVAENSAGSNNALANSHLTEAEQGRVKDLGRSLAKDAVKIDRILTENGIPYEVSLNSGGIIQLILRNGNTYSANLGRPGKALVNRISKNLTTGDKKLNGDVESGTGNNFRLRLRGGSEVGKLARALIARDNVNKNTNTEEREQEADPNPTEQTKIAENAIENNEANEIANNEAAAKEEKLRLQFSEVERQVNELDKERQSKQQSIASRTIDNYKTKTITDLQSYSDKFVAAEAQLEDFKNNVWDYFSKKYGVSPELKDKYIGQQFIYNWVQKLMGDGETKYSLNKLKQIDAKMNQINHLVGTIEKTMKNIKQFKDNKSKPKKKKTSASQVHNAIKILYERLKDGLLGSQRKKIMTITEKTELSALTEDDLAAMENYIQNYEALNNDLEAMSAKRTIGQQDLNNYIKQTYSIKDDNSLKKNVASVNKILTDLAKAKKAVDKLKKKQAAVEHAVQSYAEAKMWLAEHPKAADMGRPEYASWGKKQATVTQFERDWGMQE